MVSIFAQISGTLFNAGAIIIATLIGLLIGSRLSNSMRLVLMQAVSLPALYIGWQSANSLEKVPDLFIPGVVWALISLGIGGIIGELLRIEEHLEALGEKIKRKIGAKGRFTQGFVNASLLFCIGPMAILGSIENGLGLGMQILLLKSILDAITSIAMSSIYGFGVGFSAFPILIYQGSISLIAALFSQSSANIKDSPEIILLSGIGGLIVLSVGINILLNSLGIEDKRIKIASFLPSLAIGPLLYWLIGMFK